MLTVVCLMLCLGLIYTFPLHKDSTTKHPALENRLFISVTLAPITTTEINTESVTIPLKDFVWEDFIKCPSQTSDSQSPLPYDHTEQEHSEGIVDRTKKMAMNLEHALRKFIDSSPNKARAKCSDSKNGVIDGDLSNYEQLVIMKKYPFLDLQEVDFNLRPLAKNSGQNIDSAQVLSAQDPSFCELADESPNVEITNRGLSGFALPTKVSNTENTLEDKINKADKNLQNAKRSQTISSSTKDPPDDLSLIESLEEDIKNFEQHMG